MDPFLRNVHLVLTYGFERCEYLTVHVGQTNLVAVYPPTPPIPKTATRESARISIASLPYTSCVLENWFNISFPLCK